MPRVIQSVTFFWCTLIYTASPSVQLSGSPIQGPICMCCAYTHPDVQGLKTLLFLLYICFLFCINYFPFTDIIEFLKYFVPNYFQFLLVVPIEFFRWIIIIVAGSASACFVSLNIKSNIPGNDLTVVVVSAFVLQIALAIFIKICFFRWGVVLEKMHFKMPLLASAM